MVPVLGDPLDFFVFLFVVVLGALLYVCYRDGKEDDELDDPDPGKKGAVAEAEEIILSLFGDD